MDETPQQYVQRITACVGEQDPLAVQASTAQILERLIAGTPVSDLCTRPAAGRWSVGEIVAHLADAEIVLGFRMRLVLGAPGVAIIAYDQDRWASSGHYETRSASDSVEQFRVLRDANLALLRSLTPDQWAQYGVHSERGHETIEHMVRLAAGHDINHLRQIDRILGRQPDLTGDVWSIDAACGTRDDATTRPARGPRPFESRS